jgi:ADP-ribose pyrophosphatase
MSSDDIADKPADIELSEPELLAKAFRDYVRYNVTVRGPKPLAQKRDVILGGKVIALLPIDLARNEIVLIQQFRLPAHLGTGKGEMIEIVAGRVDAGETPVAAARRECTEELGVAPTKIVELFSYLTTPGITDEHVTMFVASIDAAAVPAETTGGGEHIRTLRVSIDAALAALARNAIHNGPAVIGLQWLALNRGRLKQLLGA